MAAPIDGYLAELDRALRGPRRVKSGLLREARDSLVDATEAYAELGLPPEAAARRAVHDFGEVSRIAPGYQAELALAQGRRTALLAFGILVAQPPIWHLVAWQTAEPDPMPGLAGVLDVLVSWLGMLAVAVALLAVWASGTGVRRLGTDPRRIRLTGIFAFAVAGTFSTIGVLLALVSPINGPIALARLPIAVVVLILPMLLVARNGARCLATARAASSR
ncbi:permease prefix domain 1-containing protein [Plantactinospora veratri]|uniref:Permease prefix domain 1-containing protein n=1 Tax=Plantactinospora veratri TaxID=1436122 RepID=A0ABU7S7W3_9ACTN